MWCALALWIGAYAGYEIETTSLDVRIVVALFVGGMFLIVLVGCLLQNQLLLLSGLLILFATLGIMLSLVSCFMLDQHREAIQSLDQETYRIRIEEDLMQGDFGYQAQARVYCDALPFSFLVELYTDEKLSYGSEGTASLSFSVPSEDARAFYNRNGLVGTASLYSFETLNSSALGDIAIFRAHFAQAIDSLITNNHIDIDTAALIKALIIGDRSDLFASPLYQEVKVLGLAHLVAVSGSHLVIVMGFLNLIVRHLPLAQGLRIGIQLIILLGYVVMVGLPISCIRAAIMTAVSIVSIASTRRSHAISSLSVVIIGLICLIPSTASSLSFALSVLSTLGIIVFMPLFSSWLKGMPSWFIKAIGDPFVLTLAAMGAILPFSLSVFCQLSLIAPITNVLSVPFITAICCLGLIACLFMPLAPLCSGVLGVIGIITSWYCAGISFFASLPGIAIPIQASFYAVAIVVALLSVVFWILWPPRPAGKQVIIAVSVCVIMFGFATLPSRNTEIIMLDVGQGDSFLIRSEGKTMLVDTGNSPQKLYAALARNRCNSLDALLITHADDDHCGCIADLKGVISCKTVLVADGVDVLGTEKTTELLNNAHNLVGNEHVSSIGKGDFISFGAVSLQIVSPESLVDEGENQDSICFVMQVDSNSQEGYEWSAFFCGDAEARVVEKLISEKTVGDIDILKVAHHGAESALSEKLTQTLRPEISLISVGDNNRYGHPHETTLSFLENSNSQIYRSDHNGDVVCKFEPEKIVVSTMR